MLRHTRGFDYDKESFEDPADNSDPVKKLRGVIQNVGAYLLSEFFT